MRKTAPVLFILVAFCLSVMLAACSRGPGAVSSTPTLPPVPATRSLAADDAQALATPQATRVPAKTRTPTATRRATTASSNSTKNGFKTITRAELPPEALKTLSSIQRGGPFPYRQDGQVFQNREGILPKKAQGYYQEYTVDTPNSADRGARRIITGDKDEYYYTADHYRSFKIILDP